MTRAGLCPRHREQHDRLRSMLAHWTKSQRKRWIADTASQCRACRHLPPAVLPHTPRQSEET